jgi:hypothetical protein
VTLHRIFAFAYTAADDADVHSLANWNCRQSWSLSFWFDIDARQLQDGESGKWKTSEDMQFSPLGWYLSKTLRLHREYRRLFPDGQLLLQARLLMALGFRGLLVGVWALCFFER